MLETVQTSGRRLSRDDIHEAESELGLRLPDVYKDFLMRFNGGTPFPERFPIEGMADNPVGRIQLLFGIDTAPDSRNITWNHRVFAGRMPDNLLPIGCTGSGDVLCLSLYGADAGEVVLWDFYGEHSPPSYRNVYRIAHDFTAFLQGLQP